MTAVRLRVLAAGMATLQDLGRPGWAHLGVSLNGAADGDAARVANVLVANPEGAGLVEVTGSVLAFVPDAPVVAAVTGAADRLTVDGTDRPVWETLVVEAGQTVRLDAPRTGLRSYLALNGRIAATSVLGSVAPDTSLGVGRVLRAGDVVALASAFTGLDHPYTRVPVFRFGARPPARSAPLVVQTTPGPDASGFPGAVDGAVLDEYEVSAQSDQVGLRLLGPTPRRASATEILSRGVPVGAVEVPPSGGLLVLLRGRLLTAGYPVLAVATSESVDRLGQARPGDRVRLEVVGLDQADAAGRRHRAELDRLAARVASALGAVGLGHLVSPAAPRATG